MPLALILSRSLRFKRFIRGAVLLPFVIPTALTTLGWLWMYDSLYSVITWTLNHVLLGPLGLGILEVNWLGSPILAMASVIVVNVWRGLPFFAVTVLAGLTAIPTEFYEAAEVDGAGRWGRFWYVTLPLLRPILAIVILFSTIFTFADFNIVYVLTRGGRRRAPTSSRRSRTPLRSRACSSARAPRCPSSCSRCSWWSSSCSSDSSSGMRRAMPSAVTDTRRRASSSLGSVEMFLAVRGVAED